MNDTTKPSEYLGYWGEKYKNDLLTDILPFWLKYGIDHENGGYFTCLDRDGSLLDTNKSVWFQGRFAFILAYAYNIIICGIRYLPHIHKIIFYGIHRLIHNLSVIINNILLCDPRRYPIYHHAHTEHN